ncbi:hypothetical protein [Lutibacter sp. B1]|uniref:hypothetical protein n=1 Tax=Lutibacter sp. B1 TaxID=2725996 RepID=UPI0014577527|nr:hypothetical protein [Lutibacter sp. B1]NLP59409.1 hypothetical protein [Lutibacter sp. B1]
MKRIFLWFYEGKFLYLSLIIFIIGINLDKVPNDFLLIDRIKIYGLILQLIGASTIIISLKNKLIFFKDSGIIQFFLEYFKRFPFKKKQNIVNLKGTITGSSKLSGRLSKTIEPLKSFEEITDYFNGEIENLKNDIYLVKKDFNLKINSLNENIENNKKEMKGNLEKTEKLISDSAVSDIWLELFGVFTILIGLIFGTIPEIVKSFIY